MDFDWDEIGKVLAAIIPVIILVLVNVVFRKQKEQKTRLGVVHSLLSEIDYNQKLVEAFSFQWQVKKFKTRNWKRNEDKMDYIDQSLHTTLSNAYEIAEGFNQEIDAAKKHKSASYLTGIQADKLRVPLAQSKQGLEEWLKANTGKKEMLPRHRSLSG